MILKPSLSAMLNQSRKLAATKSGAATNRRLIMGRWLNLKKSAMMRRALRNAVSPLVIGAATTPRIAKIPPMKPNQPLLTAVTTSGA